jgi:hypothetical protein
MYLVNIIVKIANVCRNVKYNTKMLSNRYMGDIKHMSICRIVDK